MMVEHGRVKLPISQWLEHTTTTKTTTKKQNIRKEGARDQGHTSMTYPGTLKSVLANLLLRVTTVPCQLDTQSP